MRAKKASYTDEFRSEAVGLYLRTDRTVREVANDLGINRWTLRYWIERDEMKRKKRPASSTAAPKEETVEQRVARLEREKSQLLKENERLKEDREILKKAAAFFAKESE